MLGFLRSGSKHTKTIWWIVTIATVGTFLIGFNFFGFMGRDNTSAARRAGSYGTINGESVGRDMWTIALETEKMNFRQRYGSDPADRDLHSTEQLAWRRLVTGRLMSQAAAKDGIKVTDSDILFTMTNDPPAAVFISPVFQTNGKFDPDKYRQALAMPTFPWGTFEDQVRLEAPANKLQQRLLTAAKWSESEIREGILDRTMRLNAVICMVPPADSGLRNPSDEQLQRAYEKYKSRMASPAGTQLEVAAVPIEYSADEVKQGMDIANALYQRAQKGEDWYQLCRDNSEGANADHGGVVDHNFTPSELGPIGQLLTSHKPGDVLPPQRQGGTIILFRIMDPARDTVAKSVPAGQYKLGQILVKVRPSGDALATQVHKMQDLAKRAGAVGLGRAASERGMSTMKTNYFDLDNMPQQLSAVPEASDWGITHAKGDVSPVFEASDMLFVAQVADKVAPGVPTRQQVADRLKEIADYDTRVENAKPRADKLAAALKAGASLEDAAKSVGLASTPVVFSHAQPDQAVAASPELQGLLWASQPGKVVGPVRAPTGWYFGRVVGTIMPPDSLVTNERVRMQVRQEIVSKRQRDFFNALVSDLWHKAKIVDARSTTSVQ